jgi:hypothetical protein
MVLAPRKETCIVRGTAAIAGGILVMTSIPALAQNQGSAQRSTAPAQPGNGQPTQNQGGAGGGSTLQPPPAPAANATGWGHGWWILILVVIAIACWGIFRRYGRSTSQRR